ncbi:MAG: hypothetical protein AMJ62_00770 [Myxococcales bacterium SG8_38]|nr:MAG: hypothetical protein AMJ62_00770 [Myxococcales bacterium SG8_38]
MGIRAPGDISSQAAPRSATPVQIDFESDESGNAAVPAKKGTCKMQGDGVETQMGEPNAVWRCVASRHNQLVPRNWAFTMSPMG